MPPETGLSYKAQRVPLAKAPSIDSLDRSGTFFFFKECNL